MSPAALRGGRQAGGARGGPHLGGRRPNRWRLLHHPRAGPACVARAAGGRERRADRRRGTRPLQEQLQTFLARLWAAAVEQAEERTRAERDGLQREREAMQESQRELADTADGLARRNEDLKGT